MVRNSTCFGQFLCPSSGVYSLYTQQWYIIQVCGQMSSRTRSCSKAVYKHVWHIPLLSVQWIICWWWTEELSETCRVSCQNKFVNLVHPVGFIVKKFVTMHGNMKVKKRSQWVCTFDSFRFYLFKFCFCKTMCRNYSNGQKVF